MTSVELFDSAVHRVLCIVAHPDDMEYGASAAVAHWTRSSAAVEYLLLTHGEAGMQRDPDEAATLREGEQLAACRAVGVEDLTILNHPDGILQPTLELRRDVAREIRRTRPDTVVTMTWEVEPPWGLNQADHRVAGLTVVDAVAAAGNRWIFPELIREGLEPWKVSRLLVTGATQPTHAVAVSEEDVTAAVASLESHRAYLADLPDHPAPAEFIPPMLQAGGDQVGVPLAVPFRQYNL